MNYKITEIKTEMNVDLEQTPEQIAEIKYLTETANFVTNNCAVQISPGDMTTDDVRWLFPFNGEAAGYGYIPKGKKKIYLVRCPACKRENYASNVSSGFCTWCPFDANKKPDNKKVVINDKTLS